MFCHISIEWELVEFLHHFLVQYVSYVSDCDLFSTLSLSTLYREFTLVDLILQILTETFLMEEMLAIFKRKYFFLDRHVADLAQALALLKQLLSPLLGLFFILLHHSLN